MASFKDAGGRMWVVEVNVAAMKRVRSLLGIDLFKLVGDGFKPLAELLSDPCQMVDVIYVLCKEQADKEQVSDEAFGRLMAGDVLQAAADAFLEALVFFYPAPQRVALLQVIEKGRKVRDMATIKLEKALAAVEPEAILKAMENDRGNPSTSNGSATSTPESAGLSRTP